MNKKRSDKESMICLTPKPNQSFFVYRIQNKKENFHRKRALKKRWGGGLNKKQRKEGFLTALATAIKRDPITSRRKHANELKVFEETVRIAIKQDLSPDFNPLDYAIWGVSKNKTNATSHPNIGLIKTTFEKEYGIKCLKNLF